jgi:uncharacterized alkaline shock family protein YloU
MTTEATEGSGQATSGERRASGDGGSALATERGQTSIDDTVVEKVAGMAAREVPGVYELGGGTERAVGAVTQRVGIADPRSQGVSVEVGERQTAADLTVVVEYGESIPKVTQHVRENVIRRVEGICGLEVTEVNIAVNDLHFPGDEQPAESRVE